MATIVFGPVAGSYSDDTKWIGGVEPTSADNAQANATSANLAIDSSVAARSLDFTGYTGTLSGSSALAIGDATAAVNNSYLKLVSGMTFSYTGAITFKNASTTQHSITSAGKTLGNITLEGFATNSPNIILTDNLICGDIGQSGGVFNTNSKNVQCNKWTHAGGNGRTVTITDSTITLIGTGTGSFGLWNGTNVTLNATGSTFVIATATSNNRVFTGSAKTYGTLTYTVSGSTGKLTLDGGNTFSALNFLDASNARTLEFTASTITTFTDGRYFNVRGTSGKLMTIQSNTAGTRAVINLTKNNISTDYVSVKDIQVTGNGVFYAGTHSTDGGNNIGVVFTDPPTRTVVNNLWQYFGIDIGNDINFNGANFDTDVIDQDCEYLYGIGIRYFRVGLANYDNPVGITQERYMAQKLVSLGASVSYGVHCGGVGSDAGERALYEAVLATEAAWAQSVGVQIFQTSNEFALNNGGGLTTAQCYTYQQTLPAIVTSAGFTGEITTAESQDYMGTWKSSGLGNYGSLGGNIYGSTSSVYGINDFSHFASESASAQAALGSGFYISEWANDYGPQKDINLIDPELYAKHMMIRLNYMIANYTRPCYMHCWRFNGTDNLDLSAAKKDSGTTRLFFYDVTGQRRPIYQ